MNEEYREFAQEFAEAIVARDFTRAHKMMADWLKASMAPEDLQERIDAELRETADAAELDGIAYPTDFEVSWNSSSLDDLKAPRSWAPARAIPDAVANTNFRQWIKIQFLPDPDAQLALDAFFDLWMILVEVGDEYGVGYFEMVEPD